VSRKESVSQRAEVPPTATFRQSCRLRHVRTISTHLLAGTDVTNVAKGSLWPRVTVAKGPLRRRGDGATTVAFR
jgi:hypothetical protein